MITRIDENRALESLPNEIWKEIENSKGAYFISNLGRVMSKVKVIKGRLYPAIIFKQQDKEGYRKVPLSINKLRKNIYVHRLVAQAFIPNPKNKPQVNHINGIRNDNRVENLEWVTGDENYLHSVLVLKKNTLKINTPKPPKPIKGKEVFTYLADGSFYKKFYSYANAKKELKQSTFPALLKNQTYCSVNGITYAKQPLKHKVIIHNNDKEYKPKYTPKNKHYRGKLFVYNLKGIFVTQFESVKEASTFFQIHNIMEYIRVNKTYRGYVFKKDFVFNAENLSSNIPIIMYYDMNPQRIYPLNKLLERNSAIFSDEYNEIILKNLGLV